MVIVFYRYGGNTNTFILFTNTSIYVVYILNFFLNVGITYLLFGNIITSNVYCVYIMGVSGRIIQCQSINKICQSFNEYKIISLLFNSIILMFSKYNYIH